jgi:hypothetical protein
MESMESPTRMGHKKTKAHYDAAVPFSAT